MRKTNAGMLANAAFTSLASQASITLVNNKGDIGKTLKDMSTSSTVKATLAAALTAGVIDKLGSTSTMEALRKSGGFSDKLTFNLINATGRALTNTAINGGNLEDTLKAALVGGLVDTAHGEAASVIKGLESQYLAHKLAHALAGCVAGAAAGGACKDGAIGAAIGEVVAEMFKGQKPGVYATDSERNAYDQKVLTYSKLVAGSVAAYAGGDAQTAITTAETAVRNNFLTFDENQLRKQAAASCKAGVAQACADQTRWDQMDSNRDEKVRQVCASNSGGQECTDWRNFALSSISSYRDKTYGRDAVMDDLKNLAYSDIQELKSIQSLLNTTPYAYGKDIKVPAHIKSLVSIVADLTPIVGDVKAFYEAKDTFDYALAVVGALGPAGDAAAAAIRAAKAAHQAGNAAEVAVQLTKAERLAQNAASGHAFEGSGRQAMGVDKNTKSITETTINGAAVTIVPDAVVGGIKGTLVEFKNVINITDTSQFRGYAATGQPIILVVSPRTETISSKVWNMVRESKGDIRIYDPANNSWSMWTKS